MAIRFDIAGKLRLAGFVMFRLRLVLFCPEVVPADGPPGSSGCRLYCDLPDLKGFFGGNGKERSTARGKLAPSLGNP